MCVVDTVLEPRAECMHEEHQKYKRTKQKLRVYEEKKGAILDGSVLSNSKYTNVKENQKYKRTKQSRGCTKKKKGAILDVVGDDGALVGDKNSRISKSKYTHHEKNETPRTFATESCLGMMMKMII